MTDVKQFEAWAIAEGMDCTKSDKTEFGDVNNGPGKYLYKTTQLAFSAWLAATKAHLQSSAPASNTRGALTELEKQTLWAQLREQGNWPSMRDSWGDMEFYFQGLEDAEKHHRI